MKIGEACLSAIERHQPNGSEVAGPTFSIDRYNSIGVSWQTGTSGQFYRENDTAARIKNAVKAMSFACPEVVIFTFSGATGSSERWLIKRDGFSQVHQKDSGLRGDYCKYWHYDSVPFNYDPNYDYCKD